MRGVIRLNDPTSHVRCVIAEGDPQVLIEGVPVAFDGHKTSCGASLMSTVDNSGRG